MAREKSGHPRRIRPRDRKQFEKLAATYACGSCQSQVYLPPPDQPPKDGLIRMNIGHDDGCPILSGALPDGPDSIRAAMKAVVPVIHARTGQVLCFLPGAGKEESNGE